MILDSQMAFRLVDDVDMMTDLRYVHTLRLKS